MATPPSAAPVETGVGENAAVSTASSPAGPVLAKLPSWGASGWQALFKQPSAGTTNLTDLLAEPVTDSSSAQLGVDAGASPLFKWTSDGSMMEELMKAYKDSSPGTPTFGGGSQGNLFRDGSLLRDGSLYKDGSLTSCLQAAFQAQLDEEEQQAVQASEVAGDSAPLQQAQLPQSKEQASSSPAPGFTFTSVGSAEAQDSPQLHVPELQLGPHPGQHAVAQGQQATQAEAVPSEHSKASGMQPLHEQQRSSSLHFQQPASLQQLDHGRQLQYQQHQHPMASQGTASRSSSTGGFSPQSLHQPVHSQVIASQQSTAGSTPLQHPAGVQQPQYVYVSQGMQQPAQQLYAVPQQPEHHYPWQQYTQRAAQAVLRSAPPGDAGVPAVPPISGGYDSRQQYPHVASVASKPQGTQESAEAITRINVITSGAMGPSVWSRPNSRSSSPGLQTQASGVLQSAQQVQHADGSMQAVPRIIIRAPTAAREVEMPAQSAQQPSVVLNSRVVQETVPTGTFSQTSWSAYQQQPVMQAPQNMHMYQQQHQAPPSHHQVRSNAFSTLQQPQHQQQQQQQPQQELQMPRPGSFQELLSAPVLSERYSSAPVLQDSRQVQSDPSVQEQQQQYQQPQMHQPTPLYTTQSSAVLPSQVTHMPVASTHQVAGPASLQYGYDAVPSNQHVHSVPGIQNQQQQQEHPQHQQQQQQLQQHDMRHYQQQPGHSNPVHAPSSVQAAMTYSIAPPGPGHIQPSHPSQQQTLLSRHPHHPRSEPSSQQAYAHQQPQYVQQLHQPQNYAQTPHAMLLQDQQQGIPITHFEGGTIPGNVAQVPDGRGQSTWSAPPPTGLLLNSYPAHFSHDKTAQQADESSQRQHSHHHQQQQQQPQMPHHTQHPLVAVSAHTGSAVPEVIHLAPQPEAIPGRAYYAIPQAVAPASSIGPSSTAGQQPLKRQAVVTGYDGPDTNAGRQTGSAGPQQVSHGTVLLTSRPARSAEAFGSGKVVSFAPGQGLNAMPSIPGPEASSEGSKDDVQAPAGSQGAPVQPGRKFKRDRSSRKNSFSLPPVPPKKQASAAVEFSPASSLDYALQGAASAPIPLPDPASAPGFPAALAAANMRHSASCQDVVTGPPSGTELDAAAPDTVSAEKSSRSSSADVIFCADGIDFNSRAWKMMSRKEKNRASAAASRARREAYTESLEIKVRKLQAERDWLQEQIEPGSVEKPPETSEEMQLPARPPIRHLSF